MINYFSLVILSQKTQQLSGGYHGNSGTNDSFFYDIKKKEWIPTTIKGTKPSPRAGHTSVFIEKTLQILIFGGAEGSQYFKVYFLN
jgi:hypothetical protein